MKNKLVTIFFLLALFSANLFAQSSANYTVTTDATGSLALDMNGNAVDMSTGTTTLLASGLDDTRSPLTDIGFNFTLMGRLSTNFSLTENGVIQLGGNTLATDTYLISANTTLTLLAPFANDMRVGSDGKVHYKMIGSAPNRVLVIEYLNHMIRYLSAAAPGGGTWQVRLYEATGVVEYVYGSMVTNSAGQQAVNIGFGINTTANSFVSINSSHVANTSGTFATFTPTASSTVAHLHSTADGSRRFYRFTPPVAPDAPTNLTFSAVNATGMTLNWIDAATESGYNIYRSLDGISYTLVGTVAANVITSAQTGLVPSTPYYWRVQSFNEGFVSSFLSGSQATTAPGAVTSLASGNWDVPGTWSSGAVPTAGDVVTIATGHVVTINTTAVAIGLIVSGTLEFEAATARTLTVSLDVTINSTGIIRTGATGTLATHNLLVGGNLTNNGILDLHTGATVTAGPAATLTFNGGNNSNYTGTGSTNDLWILSLNKTARAQIVELNVSNFSVCGVSTASTGKLLTSGAGTGTLKISGTNTFNGVLWSATGYTIPATMGFWLNNPNFTVNGQGGSPTVAGLFRLTSGTYNIGTSTGNSMGFNAGSVIIVEGGAINATGRFGVNSASNAITYTQSGGVITVQTIGNASSSYAGYDLGTSTSSVISISGGSVIIQMASTGSTKYDYRFQSGLGIGSVTGGTVQFGNAASGAAKTFTAYGVFPTLTIDNTSAGHTVLLGAAATYNALARNVTINNGCTLNLNGYVFLFSGTTFTNNGTLTGTLTGSNFVWFGSGMADKKVSPSRSGNMATLFADDNSYNEYQKLYGNTAAKFSAPGPQTYTGTGVVTAPLLAFALQNVNGVVISPSTTNNIICRAIRLFEGSVTNSGKLTLGNADATVNNVQFGNTTTFTAAGSFDAPLTFNLGTGGQTVSYLRTGASRTTGPEINPGRSLVSLTYDDNDVAHTLTIGGGSLAVTTLYVTTGIINTSASNLLTVAGTTTTSIVGGSATAYVSGPLALTYPASLAAGTTYNYPLGKGAYRPLAMVDAITTATGPVVIQAEVFDGNSGGVPGTGLSTLNTNRYWNAQVLSGEANLTSTKVRLTEDAMTSTMGIGKSATQTGSYALVSSTVPATGTVITDPMTSLSFFAIGERDLSAVDPTGVTATAISGSQIDIAFTHNTSNDDVVIVWNTTGTFTAPSGTPVVGTPLAGGTVLSIGTTSPVSHTGLNGITTYYYKLFSHNDEGYSIGVTANATTPCAVISSFPWGPETFAGTVPPNTCWSRWTGLLAAPSVLTTTTSGWAQDDWRNVTSPVNKASKINIFGTGAKYWMMTPQINLGTGTIHYQLEFDLALNTYDASTPPATTGTDDKFAVVISTDGGTTWTSANTLRLYDNAGSTYVYNNINPSGEHIVLDLTAYTGIVMIGFYGESTVTNADNDLMIDNLVIQEPPACTAPTSLTGTGITSSAVNVGWAAATTVQIDYGTAGHPAGTGTVVTGVTTNPYSISGLTAQTTYDIYVRQDCGSGSYSTWAGPLTITTACGAIVSLPWNENFDGVTIPAIPGCWFKENGEWVTTNNANSTYDADARSGTQFLRETYSATNEYIWSPGFQLTAGTHYDFSFWWAGDTYAGWVGDVYINGTQVSTGATQLGGSFITSDVTTTTTYAKVIRTFTPTTTGVYYFAIRVNGTSDPWYLSFDDFSLDLSPACITPTNLTATSITTTSASLGWTEIGTATSWDIEYGTTPYVPTGTPTVSGVSNPYALSGLTSGTGYAFYVRASCGSGETSAWAGPYIFNTATAPLTLPYAQDFEGTFPPQNFINYGTKLWTQATNAFMGGVKCAKVSYSPLGSANLEAKITLPTTPYMISFWWKDADATENRNKLLAQYKEEGIVREIDDQLIISHDTTYFEVSTNNGTTWTSLTFLSAPTNQSAYSQALVDLSAYANHTISIRWRDESDGTLNAYGTSLDNIIIEPLPSCPAPSTLTATGITESSANLGWTQPGTAAVWDIEYGPTPYTFTGVPTVAGVTTNPYALSGLTASTQYAFYVRASCGGGDYSSWTGPYTFNTTCGIITGSLSESFDGTTFPTACWTRINAGSGNNWARTTASTHSGAGVMTYTYNSSYAANSWMMTPGFALQSGKNYYVTFYQNTAGGVSFPEKLKVTVGGAPDVVSQTTTIWDNNGGTNLTNTTYELRLALFSCTTTGTYYFGFNVYSDADMYTLFVDDVHIYEQPPVDLSLKSFYQETGLAKNLDMPVLMNKDSKAPDGISLKPLDECATGVASSNINNTVTVQKQFPLTLANITLKAVIENLGINAASYLLDYTINGVAQPQFTGPSVPNGSTHTATLTYTPTVFGTFLVPGTITATGDAIASNNTNQFRLRSYPTGFARTIYDRGDNLVDTYVGWNSSTTRMKAGVRFTAATEVKLAGVDFICRTESITSGEYQVQVRAAGTTTTAPGDVLYTQIYTASDLFSSSGDYIYFPFGNDAPVIAAGSDYWITVKAPTGILFPGGAQSTGITAGRSFYEGSTDTTSWIALVLDSEEFAWILRAVHVPTAPPAFPLSVNVMDGWNMVSIPGLHPTNQSVDTWWANRNPLASVFKYSAGYVAVTTAAPREGYWMLHTGTLTYNTGDEWPAGGIQIVTHDPITVAAGWNMIGGYENSPAISALTTVPDGIIVPNTAYGWNGAYFSATNLVPGYGYWILISAPGGVINVPTGSEEGTLAKEDNKDKWGKITVTDASGKKFTLYSVDDKVDLLSYSLPPLPPEGCFDVRFASNKKAENLKTSQTLEMRGMEYPVRIMLENTAIKVQDETGKLISKRMKAGDELIISNSQISKLFITESIVPDVYSLDQNYPNPFNPSTLIQFTLPEDVKNVTLTIYDALGQKVTELLNGAKEAGYYQYQWNASNVASGLYIYQLRTEKFVSTKKMMLLK